MIILIVTSAIKLVIFEQDVSWWLLAITSTYVLGMILGNYRLKPHNSKITKSF